jgi:hypothetical protein
LGATTLGKLQCKGPPAQDLPADKAALLLLGSSSQWAKTTVATAFRAIQR